MSRPKTQYPTASTGPLGQPSVSEALQDQHETLAAALRGRAVHSATAKHRPPLTINKATTGRNGAKLLMQVLAGTPTMYQTMPPLTAHQWLRRMMPHKYSQQVYGCGPSTCPCVCVWGPHPPTLCGCSPLLHTHNVAPERCRTTPRCRAPPHCLQYRSAGTHRNTMQVLMELLLHCDTPPHSPRATLRGPRSLACAGCCGNNTVAMHAAAETLVSCMATAHGQCNSAQDNTRVLQTFESITSPLVNALPEFSCTADVLTTAQAANIHSMKLQALCQEAHTHQPCTSCLDRAGSPSSFCCCCFTALTALKEGAVQEKRTPLSQRPLLYMNMHAALTTSLPHAPQAILAMQHTWAV